MFQVKFADIGEGLTEGKVVEIFVKEGDTVKEGQELFAVETDKVNSDIYAQVSGVIKKIYIKVDQEIKVGEVVIDIDDGSAGAAPSAPKKEEPKKEEENASVVGSTPVSNEVISRNVETPASSGNAQIKATPLARKIAADKKIDLSRVKPSGPNNRILVKDLDNVGGSSIGASSFNFSSGAKKSNQPFGWDSVPMSGIRKATVKAMEASSSDKSAFTAMRQIDFTKIYDLRKQLIAVVNDENTKITFLAFIVKAVAKALVEFPNINVRIDKENNAILQMNSVNVGIAVDSPRGLFVPNIKNADQLHVVEIAKLITELADKTRSGKITPAEMQNGTFTVSNFGSVGLEFATPIINGLESAILGVGSMTKTPVFVGDEVKAAWMMPFSLTCDHRIIDGADAGRFLAKIQEYATNPLLLLL